MGDTLPAEAIEAAAEALYTLAKYPVGSHWGDRYRSEARAALLAALPHLVRRAAVPSEQEGLDRDEQLGITEYLLRQADIEVPDDDWPECVDLCDNRVCEAVGCLVSKYRRVRALSALDTGEPK